MAETPRFAHLMILLLMGAELSLALSLAIALGGVIARRRLVTSLAAGAAMAIAAWYACVLLGVGWLSGEKILAPGQWKYFCEADCHIAYSVESVRADQASSTVLGSRSPYYGRLVVRLKTCFDQNSIARFRGNGPLKPEPQRVVLVDAAGVEYFPSPETASAGGAISAPPSTPITQPLRPGEAYTTTFLFEVPRDARDLRLLITDVDPASRFIIDHENSPFHGKILLRLPRPDDSQNSVVGQAGARGVAPARTILAG